MSDLFIISEMDELHKILNSVNERLQIVAMHAMDSKKPAHNSDYAALVQLWTLAAQNSSNTDSERAVYYCCAELLHQLNAKHCA